MTDRTMRPAPYLALAIAVLSGLFAATRAEAQQAINSNAVVYIDGDKVDNGSNVFISQAECNAQEWRFELQGYAQTVPFLEMWATNNISTNCADQANRNSANNNMPICWQIGTYANAVRGTVTFRVRGAEIFNNNNRSDTTRCDEGIMGSKYKVQFVTLDSPTTPMTTTVTASNNNPNQITAVLTLYSKVPVAPSNIRGINGGRTIGIRYNKIDNDPLTEYRAYFDHDPNAPVIPNNIDGGPDPEPVTCGTGKFGRIGTLDPDGGADVQSPPTGSDITVDKMTTFQSGTTKGESLTIRDLDEKNIPLNTYTAVSVIAIDGAGNLGQLSDPICVKRVPTEGYLARCRDAGTECGDLESCSLSSRNTGSAFWLSACTLALSAWARRRRRSN
jgi:hypothetical protein